MSACLTSGGGGAAAYSFELEKMKSPPPPPPSSSTTTRATSPSSTISESSNSPLAISTRKPRTPRKRPNQTYNEAAALLSSAYPNLFSPSTSSKKTHSNPQFYGFAKSPLLSDNDDAASELLLESVEEPDFLFLPTIQARSSSEYFSELKEVSSGGGGEMKVNQFEFSDEFDAESILDEEVEVGIDSIMGIVESTNSGENRGHLISRLEQMVKMNRKGFKFPLGLGLRSALREHNDASWCRFHTVDFEQISPRIRSDEEKIIESKKLIGEKSKNKKKNKKVAEAKRLDSSKEDAGEEKSGELMLKLDYDGVLEAWSEKESPFSDDVLGSEATTGADVNARLAQIDLFGDNGVREASVLRYKEKRRTRLFSKKIRYQVRKVNADQRPRMKVSTLIRGKNMDGS
ncbi:protein CHLOROPLAST IMPORT APPARATUS 2 isoform X2 [Raphanus sativus]|uniref:Protein CHLOROPLAST IMPORT APPARATUS 2 isoform X2 n=1 Tax=Raphanus sativus TaxID=3726 RepID=A0A6J0LBU6_RAPSA|nr:protein CHLOROPLAST IMPORT APPARATUS 2 isoform X2 [Raphanus sativus]